MFKRKSLLLVLIYFGSLLAIHAQKKVSSFRDSIDNALDFSTFLSKKHGFLPILIPITEPAVGYGAAVGLLHFIPKKDQAQRPDMVVAVGGLTSNQTWMGGGGYIGFWKNDGIRYRGIAGYGELNLQFYGIGDTAIDFSLNSFVLVQQLNFRLGKSDFFLGGKYQFSKITIPFFEDSDIIDPIEFDLKNSGLSFIAEYDNLNNFLSPSKGIKIHLSYDQNLEIIGSDRNWGKLNFYSHMYFPVNEKWIPALRLESSAAFGDSPFYALPYINLRGVSALRYQGELIALAETEQLYNLTERWSVLGFTGIGTSFNSLENLKAEELVWNAGGGFRYLIARALGLKMGIDVARGPEDWAYYVVIGRAWLR